MTISSFLRKPGILILCMFAFYASQAQKRDYQGLMWEITGNGLKKPSYLYGTMHVSNKIAFHLSDSFYTAISGCDVVALEQNLDSVVDKWINPMRAKNETYYYNNGMSETQGKEMMKLVRYGNEDIISALAKDPSEINGVLYRYSFNNENFEEDTYLDLYIYKTGKKLKKQVTGVEDYDQVNELVEKAYNEPFATKNKKKKKYVSSYSVERLFLDAYRKGNLYILDSLDQLTHSEHYLEYMLYKRNHNMVRAMDSIMKTSSLFVGVGASHLPGEQGVINLLRKMGYQLRAIPHDITSVNPRKEKIDAIHFPLVFKTQYSADSAFRVDVPGTLIETSVGSRYIKYLYPELVNGAFFTVTRVKTYTMLKNLAVEDVLKTIDTLLYENIPGKIIKKSRIKVDGYPGYEVLNRTKKGDYQRYYIISTPVELFVFKLGGHGEMARSKDGDRFFSSIRLHGTSMTKDWFDFQPVDSTLSMQLPLVPSHNMRSMRHPANSERVDYTAYDEKTGSTYLIVRRELFNAGYLEEDTFELNVMAEGFALGGNYKQAERRHFTWQGFPALDVKYEMPGGQTTLSRFVLRGTRYEMFAQVNPPEADFNNRFFSNIKFRKPGYGQFFEYRDTNLYYTVKTPCKPGKVNDRNKADNPEDVEYTDHLPVEKSVCYVPENRGEVVRVEYYQYHKYYSVRDSAKFWDKVEKSITNNNLHIDKKEVKVSGENITLDYWLSDTNTIRNARVKLVLRRGVMYNVSANYDRVNGESEFLSTFFSTFAPADTLIGTSLFKSQGGEFLRDLASSDSITRDKALKSLNWVLFDPGHAPKLAAAIDSFYIDKNYLDRKADLVQELGFIKTDTVIPYLRKLYAKAGDTSALQIAVLKALVHRQNQRSLGVMKQLLLADAPIPSRESELNGLFASVHDSVRLAARLYPELLSLSYIDEYESGIYGILEMLLDSGFIKKDIIKNNLGQLTTQARIELKRYLADEEKNSYYSSSSNLMRLSSILMHYRQTPSVKAYIDKLDMIRSRESKLDVSILFLKHNLPVADSVLENLASNDYLRASLYLSLKEIKKLDRFPARYLHQEDFARSMIAGAQNSYYNKPDTFVYLSRREIIYKNDTGYVYLFKYKNKEKDDWSLGISGLQPADTAKVSAEYFFYTGNNNLYNEALSIEEQFSKEITEAVYKKRRQMNNSSYSYYANSGYSSYDGEADYDDYYDYE